ncbi:non-ribosomal peptide synthetase [Streptomyces sp. NPDC047971]|uniref:non-ribosomal peptide synthetase n=1 Tax=Streptomyces sp. NPDC047971 TaxID=3154499 RepID=UPI0033F8836E
MAAADVHSAEDEAPSVFPVAGSCPQAAGPCGTVRRSALLPAAVAQGMGERTDDHLLAAVTLLGRKYADSTSFRAGVRAAGAARDTATATLAVAMPAERTLAEHLAEVTAGPAAGPGSTPPALVCVTGGPAADHGDAVLTVSAERTGDELTLHVDGHGHLFDAESTERALGHLVTVLTALVRTPHTTVGALALPTAAERERLTGFSGSRGTYPRDASVYELFAAQAAARPDALAVVHDGGTSLTYRRLADEAERLAHLLHAHGARRHSRIAFLMDKTDRLMVTVLAILRLGAAYVPLTPGLPFSRRDFLLADSGAALLVTDDATITADIPVLDLGGSHEIPAGHTLPAHEGSPLDTAYVMYTSGTTGTPKGVLVNNRAVVRLVRDTDYVDLSPRTTVLQTGAIAFDATTFEFWGALLNGGTLVLAPTETVLDTIELGAAIRRHGVDTLWLTAPLFNQIVDQDPAVLAGCQVLAGGEALSAPHIAAALAACPDSVFINGYGPTENTTFSVAHRITGTEGDRVPIGRPIAHSTAYVLDRDGNPQPIGIAGELHVGGDGLSDGYLGRPELNERAFVSGGIDVPERLYRTGDIARWTPDGLLEYLGRADGQIKIRGYRVEPAEIESQLLRLPGVREAVVLLRPRPGGASALCAYVTGDTALDLGALHAALGRELPEHMVPVGFWQVDAIPLTRNHKVDREALTALEPVEPAESARSEGRAPGSAREETVAAIFAEVLGVPAVSVDDDFFDLGGHSLLAIRVWSQVRSALGVEFELRQVLDTPTVAGLVASLDGGGAPAAARPKLVRRAS